MLCVLLYPLAFCRATETNCPFWSSFWFPLLCMSDGVGVQVWAHLQIRVTHVTYGSLEKYFFSFLKLAAFLSGKKKKNSLFWMSESKSSALASML